MEERSLYVQLLSPIVAPDQPNSTEAEKSEVGGFAGSCRWQKITKDKS
jgi:hypothetical protein